MGYKRKMGRAVLGLALMTFAAVADAEPAREPLVVTRLPEPELRLVALNDPERNLADEAVQRFARALDQATVAEQQAIAARCKSSDPVPSGGAARAAWEANCRYRRR